MVSQSTLSEADSKRLISPHGVPFAQEIICVDAIEAVAAAEKIGYPVVIKVSGDSIAHKTERGLVKLHLKDAEQVSRACEELFALTTVADGNVSLLVAEMVKGDRELIVGVVKDPQFGHMVALGIGGVFAEAIDDVVLRPLPIEHSQALSMINELQHQSILGEFRGSSAVKRDELADLLVRMGDVCAQHPSIESLDINPLIVRPDGSLVAVDALVSTTPQSQSAAGT